ncbi:GNAT family N-acetyltransferase [Lactobacillus xylocopicola]|uniref:Ribosomal protein acetylating enzyme n=1 Tax=Lactobacillus xylocopicola TaxID=2976676 RepID=A0ABN6SIA0_9LACO|nr:GNAT family protein [Lactobacillus xylocopicola]BDR60022.1 ribosomal protein acetylating enzyme [Lactobacillus xylocopicola]
MFVSRNFTLNNLTIQLALPELSHAPALFELVKQDRSELSRFLPWADKVVTVQDEVDFIKMMRVDTANYRKLVLVVLVDHQPAGMVDVHKINLKNESGEIGYWLGQAFQGQGIMTKAVEQVIDLAWVELGLHRLNLVAEHDNHASRAIATRLHFTHVALLKDELKYHGKFHDLDLYTIIGK